MFLKDFISGGGAMFTDTGGLFDADTLTTRATLLFGYRTIREDIPVEDIAAAGQNVINTQKPFLTALFDYAEKFNPFATARREVTTSGLDDTDTEDSGTKTNTGTKTTTNTGTKTTTNAGTVTTEGNATDTPNVVTSITKSAYNATESRPAETTTNSGTNTAQSSGTTTNDLTDTVTDDLTAETTDNLTETTNKNGKNSRIYSEIVKEQSVSGAEEIQRAFDKYIQPYDYLAREIVNQICNLFW